MIFERIKELKAAYTAELKRPLNSKQQKAIVFQFFVDMCQIGLAPDSSIQILATGDQAIFDHPSVQNRLSSGIIDYIKSIDLRDVYEAAGVPLERDFADP